MPVFTAPDGRRLHYVDEGEGPVTLCLSGLSRNARDFEAPAAALQPGRRILRLDSRGRGGSGFAQDPAAEYQPAVEAGDALALLDELGLESVAVLGTSRGGILGMLMAATRPGAVSRLALNDIGAEVQVAGLRRIQGYLGKAPAAGDFDALAEEMAAANADRFPGVPVERWAMHARAAFDDDGRGRPVLSYDPALAEVTAAAIPEDAGTIDLRPLWAACGEIPVLCLRGANSDILAAETVTEMARDHSSFTAVEVADRGHAPFLDEPEALAALDAFLPKAPA